MKAESVGQAEESKEESKAPVEPRVRDAAEIQDDRAYGFGMRHSDEIPDSFLAAHCYDETVINANPAKAMLDSNPHKTGRKWRLVKKFEREIVCFDEERYLSDNFDEEILEIINALKNAE